MADFVEICNVCARKAIIEAAKRIINSDKVCHSYSDLNFGVTFFGTQCIINISAHFVSFIFYFSSWCHVLEDNVGDHVGIRVQRLLSSIALLSANYTATNGGVTTPAHFQCWPPSIVTPRWYGTLYRTTSAPSRTMSPSNRAEIYTYCLFSVF